MSFEFVGFPEEVLGYIPEPRMNDPDYELDPEFINILEEDIKNGKFDKPSYSISGQELKRMFNSIDPEEQPAPVTIPEEPKFDFPRPDTTIKRTSNIYRKSGS